MSVQSLIGVKMEEEMLSSFGIMVMGVVIDVAV